MRLLVYIKQLVILSISSVLSSCAASETADDESFSSRSDCIYQPSIRGYSVLDESNLIVSTSGRRQYHVVLQRRAHGLRSSWGIAFKSSTGRVCSGFSEVVFERHFDGDTIRIAIIREISPEEEEDLLIRYGKKEPEFKQAPVPGDVEGADVEELDPVVDDNLLDN